jgi:hypothetical protein
MLFQNNEIPFYYPLCILMAIVCFKKWSEQAGSTAKFKILSRITGSHDSHCLQFLQSIEADSGTSTVAILEILLSVLSTLYELWTEETSK